MTKEEVEKLWMDNPESMQFLKNATKFYNLMMMYRCAIREIQTKLEVLDDEFSVENNRNPISFIKTRIKKPNSIYNKLQKMGHDFTTENIQTYLNDALCLAAKRGVDVRIITPGIPDKKFIYNITRSFYHGLVKHGVRVYEWTPGFCHAKMSVVDDCMATCGTINLDYRSLYHHFENGCFMIDCQSVLDIKSDLIKTMGECRDVTEQYCTGRSAYLRLGQLFMRLFAGLL